MDAVGIGVEVEVGLGAVRLGAEEDVGTEVDVGAHDPSRGGGGIETLAFIDASPCAGPVVSTV